MRKNEKFIRLGPFEMYLGFFMICLGPFKMHSRPIENRLGSLQMQSYSGKWASRNSTLYAETAGRWV